MRFNKIFTAMLMVVLVLLMGCSSKSEKVSKHLKKGKDYVEKGDFKSAAASLGTYF